MSLIAIRLVLVVAAFFAFITIPFGGWLAVASAVFQTFLYLLFPANRRGFSNAGMIFLFFTAVNVVPLILWSRFQLWDNYPDFPHKHLMTWGIGIGWLLSLILVPIFFASILRAL